LNKQRIKKKLNFIISLILLILLVYFKGIGVKIQDFFFHFVLAYLISYAFIPLIISFAFRYNILDRPSGRKIHTTPTPKIGGIAIFFGFIISFLFIQNISTEIYSIVIASTLIVIIGLLDDIFNLSPIMRLIVQFIAVSTVINFGVYIIIFPTYSFWGNLFNIILTFFWVIGITNSFNFLDGINGEASGLGIIIGTTLSLFAYLNGDITSAIIIMSAVGAICGFIPYNLKYRADIFMGDGGSNFLGFFLCTMTILIEWGSKPSFVNMILPIIVFFICIYDTIMTTITRIYQGKVKNVSEWINYTAKDHIHHKFNLLFDGSNLFTVIIIYFLAIDSAIFVLLYSYYRTSLRAMVIIVAALIQIVPLYSFVTWTFFKNLEEL